MSFLVIFWFSFLALVALFGFKLWESKRERALCLDVRSVIDGELERWQERARAFVASIPRRVSLRRSVHVFAHELILFFSRVAKFADTKAEYLAMRVSRSASVHVINKKKKASNFLREVREYKDGLDPVRDNLASREVISNGVDKGDIKRENL